MSEALERDLRKEIDELKSREEEIRKLRQKKETELRNIIFTHEAEKISHAKR